MIEKIIELRDVITINKKSIISFILVILWACFIFFMSSMDTDESNDKSKQTIDKAIESTLEVTNKSGITDKHPSESKMKQVIEKLNKPLRKVAHASEYCVLAILICLCLKSFNMKKYRTIIMVSVLCSFLYACTDEFHQYFVPGRTSQAIDVAIDTAGAVVGAMVIGLIGAMRKKKRKYKK